MERPKKTNFLSKNLKYLRKENGRNQEFIAELLGIKPTTYGAYERKDSKPPVDTLMWLCKYFDVSMDAICNTDLKQTGEPGPSLNSRNQSSQLDNANNIQVEFVPYKVQAGFLTNFGSQNFHEELEQFSVPNTGLGRNQSMTAFEVAGDSMMPRIFPRDRVICKQFEVESNLSQYKNKVFVVITNENDFLVKRLKDFNMSDKKAVFASDNPAYENDITLNLIDEVAQVWKVEMVLSQEI